MINRLNRLASLHVRQYKYKEAEKLYQRALVIFEKEYGAEHPDVVDRLNSLASVYVRQGKYEEPESLYQQVLAICEKKEGSDSYCLADQLRYFWAKLYEQQRMYSKAEAIYQQILAIYEKKDGADSYSVVMILKDLAEFYEKQKKYSEVEAIYQQVLAIYEKKEGADSYSVAMTLKDLAKFYEKQKKYSEAEALFQQALVIFEKGYSPDELLFTPYLNILPREYKKNTVEDELLFQRDLAITEKALGKDHPLVANSLNNLAILYLSQEKYNEVETLWQPALAIAEKALGKDHPNVASCLKSLADIYEAQANTNRAIEFRARGLEVEETNLTISLAKGSETDKQKYMSNLSRTTHAIISLHLQKIPNNAKAANLAFTTILRRKGRILDFMTDSLHIVRQNLTPENQRLLHYLATTRNELAALTYQKQENISLEQYDLKVLALRDHAEELEAYLSDASVKFRKTSQPVTIEAVQKLIPTDAALVEIMQYKPYDAKAKLREGWGKPHYAAYILHPTGEP